MVINDIDLKSKEEELKELKQKLSSFLITQTDNFEEQFEVVFRRKELEEKRKKLLKELSGEQLRDYPDYQSRLEILKILGYVDKDERGLYWKFGDLYIVKLLNKKSYSTFF